MVTVNCGNPYCGGTFSAYSSPAICPYCNGVNHFNVAPQLSSYEIAQIQNAYNSLNYQNQLAIESSKKSFKNWIKDSFSWLWNRLKEVGAVKTGLATVAALFGIDISWE